MLKEYIHCTYFLIENNAKDVLLSDSIMTLTSFGKQLQQLNCYKARSLFKSHRYSVMKILNAHVDPKCHRHIHKSYLLYFIVSQFNQGHTSPFSRYMNLMLNSHPILRLYCGLFPRHFTSSAVYTVLISPRELSTPPSL